MRLGDLLAALGADVVPPVEDHSDTVVRRVVHDSRLVQAGDMFCCVPGATYDGHAFAEGAEDAGATAILAERPLSGVGVPVVVVSSVRRTMPLLAAASFGHPSASLDLVGVTGTNGKTSVVHLLGSVLASAGRRAATWGTLSGVRTTPESTDLQATLAGWVSDGVEVGAMEVSSHALAQHRIDGTTFEAVGFTMLGRDHLDFHGSMAAYEAAKARLFAGSFASRAVVTVDNEPGRRMAALAEKHGMDVVAVDPESCDATPLATGTVMRWRGESLALTAGGVFTAANALVAAEIAVLLGVEPDDVATGLSTAPPVPGRFEPVVLSGGPSAVVDYAHTPDALSAVLDGARRIITGSGRLVLVFGCGGERDQGKRAEMGRVAERMADRVFVTSDNPRGEPPEEIIRDILSGMEHAPKCVEVDRRRAIAEALAAASPEDLIVVAGRGHEKVQQIAIGDLPFDDAMVIAEEWKRLTSRDVR